MGNEIKPESAGAALVRIRWDKATPADRAEAARKMLAGRKARLKKRAKGVAK